MADIIDYKIYGDDMQIVEIELDPGEGVRAEVGAMMYMVDGIEMQTSTGGGMFKGFKRMITGESFFILLPFCIMARERVRWLLVHLIPVRSFLLSWINWVETFYVRKMLFSVQLKGLKLKLHLPRRLEPDYSGARALSCSALRAMAFPSFTRVGRLSKKS